MLVMIKRRNPKESGHLQLTSGVAAGWQEEFIRVQNSGCGGASSSPFRGRTSIDRHQIELELEQTETKLTSSSTPFSSSHLMDRHVGLRATEPPNHIVSRILQLALGLFVTTVELPLLTPELSSDPLFGFNCNFDLPCRWMTFGSTQDRWRLAKGEEVDPFLWLAATGTMKTPNGPFTLIELRGHLADSLISDLIPCQVDSAHLSFTYWTIGIQTIFQQYFYLGNADLEICLLDGMNRRFNCTGMLNSRVQPGKVDLKLSIIPSNGPGVLVLDDIKYDVMLCSSQTTSPFTLLPETLPTTTTSPNPKPREEIIRPWTIPTMPPILTMPFTIVPLVISTSTTNTEDSTTLIEITTSQSPDPPFSLLILGNKSSPLFDRRKNQIIENTNDLLCDFSRDFECRWGAEAGKWAIIQNGAIPSLTKDVPERAELPVFPAAVVIQGTAMLSSDPLNCQNGSGKLLFRRWSNRNVSIQVCALGHNANSGTIRCVDEMKDIDAQKDPSLAIFEIKESIHEPFTLNIVPIWEKESHNTYLIIDEIAYIGGCVHTSKVPILTTTHEYLTTGGTSRKYTFRPYYSTISHVEALTTRKPKTTVVSSTFSPVDPIRNSFTILTMSTTTARYKYYSTTTEKPVDYCKMLNCNFNENACNYLNHGLTKAPWTLRTKVHPNNQFVSALLSAGDYAILESPKFNGTQGINVLLFQYYRPTHAATIRLCLGTKYTKPLRTVASFTQCPPILRTLTSKNAYKWNTIHIQIPPGTTNFYLVAHNMDRNSEKAAIALDNIRVALCDPRNFEPLNSEEVYEDENPN